MGSCRSQPQATRSQVEDIKHSFQDMSRSLHSRLPWTAFLRNGTAVLLFAGTVVMFLAATTLISQAGIVAGILVTSALILHGASFILRECKIIWRVNNLLDEFFKVVPTYMDTKNISKPRGDGLYSGILLFEVASLVAGFVFDAEELYWWLPSVFACVLLAFSAVAFSRKVIQDKNDLCLIDTCQRCASTLETLLSTNQDV